MVRKDKLDEGKSERLVTLLRSQAASRPELAEDLRTEANYFEDNKERMRYPKFRKQGLFVGSGVIEAGCKTVLPQAETFRYVLDRARSQCHHCPPLL